MDVKSKVEVEKSNKKPRKKRRGYTTNVWRANESLEMVYALVEYLLGAIQKRRERDIIREQVLSSVSYTFIPYSGKKTYSGYNFDRDELWNNYFQKDEKLKRILDYRRIDSLDELEAKFFIAGDMKP